MPAHGPPEGAAPATLPALSDDAARRFGEEIAIREGDLRLSFRDLDALRLRAARALVACGIGHGDRVGIWAPNMHEWIVAAMGAQSIGAVLVPLNTRFKPVEAAEILRRSGARMLFTPGEFLGVDYSAAIRAVRPDCLERVVAFRGTGGGATGWDGFLAGGDAVPEETVRHMADLVRPDDLMDIMFTSGTTGRPKGAQMTHWQNIDGYRRYAQVWGLRENDAYLIVPPFFHTFGYKMGWLCCLATGACALPVAQFDPAAILPLIARERVSVLTGPPTVFRSLLDYPGRERFDLSTLRLSMTGAATVPVDLIRAMRDDLGFETVAVAWGMTECNGIGTCTRSGDDPDLVAHSVGLPLPGVEIRCVDSDGRVLAAGGTGEILIRSPYVTKGFFDDPAAFAEVRDADGWLHTGDVGHIGADGYLRVTDRLKDMYICGGFNCYPAEIEKMLLELPGVAQAAVIGVPDARLGEVGKAFIVRAPGAGITGAEVIARARERMANFKVPRFVEFVEGFPLNASGKVLKTELRRRESAAGGDGGIGPA